MVVALIVLMLIIVVVLILLLTVVTLRVSLSIGIVRLLAWISTILLPMIGLIGRILAMHIGRQRMPSKVWWRLSVRGLSSYLRGKLLRNSLGIGDRLWKCLLMRQWQWDLLLLFIRFVRTLCTNLSLLRLLKQLLLLLKKLLSHLRDPTLYCSS